MFAGISSENRALLQRLHESFQRPFDAREAAAALELPLPRIRRLLRYLADRGWLTRVAKGLYATVSLAAREPANWPVDPWVVAMRRFAPCYIGGWSALAHHDLTEQIFRSLVVMTSRRLRQREEVAQHTLLQLRHRDESKFFGLETVWREGIGVQVSDPERTLIDVLDEPALAGGISQVAEAINAYFAEDDVRSGRLIAYAEQLGNRAVFKRLGYLLDTLRVRDDQLVQACLERQSAGLTLLDPSLPATGSRNARWRLLVNANLAYLVSP